MITSNFISSLAFAKEYDNTELVSMSETEKIIRVRTVQKETVPYCQIYKEGYEAMTKLNTAGIFVLSYVMDNVPFGDNEVRIKQSELAKEKNINQSFVSRGVKDLIDNNFLEKNKEKPFWYIINHNYIFKGNRLKFLIELIKLKEKQDELKRKSK